MQAMRQRLIAAVRLIACLCLLLIGVQAAADENPFSDINYRLGEGLRVADTGLSLGGYATASYENLQHGPLAYRPRQPEPVCLVAR